MSKMFLEWEVRAMQPNSSRKPRDAASFSPWMATDRSWDLWITGAAGGVHGKLSRTRDLPSTFLIRLEADAPMTRLSDATLARVEKLLSERNILRLLVCGQPEDAIGLVTAPPNADSLSDSGYDRLLDRMRNRAAGHRHAQAMVVDWLEQLHAFPSVADAVRDRGLSIYGMYYLPESDALLVFDPATGRFHPLTPAR